MKITCRFKRTSIISGLLLSAGLVAPALPVFAAGSWIIDVNTRTFTKMEQEVMPIGINDHRGQVAGSTQEVSITMGRSSLWVMLALSHNPKSTR